MSIIIFSRSIRSGKTTELQQWCAGKNNVAGILMPDIDGVRHFLNIKSGELFKAEKVGETAEEILCVGKYSFFKAAFKKADDFLLDAVKELPAILLIDEIGKLELRKEGLYEAVIKAIDVYKNLACENDLILVVREELLKDVIKNFDISGYRLIHGIDEF